MNIDENRIPVLLLAILIDTLAAAALAFFADALGGWAVIVAACLATSAVLLSLLFHLLINANDTKTILRVFLMINSIILIILLPKLFA
ncbi:MAG: hypothetical protein R8K20_06810 [Gallionellaceae bacterium]